MTKTELEQLIYAARFSEKAERELEAYMDAFPQEYEQYTGHKPHGRDANRVDSGFFHEVGEFFEHSK
ncbi:MAG: hypothetical protein ACRC6H_08875 [Culicoidibacterales bacterium]